jgi:RimJ/RimL family protein N-acetyltransferase
MEVECRPATEGDLELLLTWRSHPELHKNFYIQDEPIKWETHIDWWASRENRRDWIICLNEDDRWRDVGSVNVSGLDTDIPEVGVYVGEVTAYGNGIASSAVEFAVEWLRGRDYTGAQARILDDNKGSQRVFEKCGFQHAGNAHEAESKYLIQF